MTTGNITIGSPSSAWYRTKVWRGTDDKAEKKAWNPYTVTGARQFRTMTYWYDRYNSARNGWSWQYGSTLWCPDESTFTANDHLRLLGKIAEQARGHGFNAAIATAELGQTLSTVVDRARSIGRFVRYAYRGNYTAACRALGMNRNVGVRLKTRAISDFVLETRYGWQPLLSDAYEAAKSFEALTSDARQLAFSVQQTVRASKNASVSPNLYEIPATGSYTRRYKVVSREQLSAARSLGLLNPLSVLWERVPGSFVADWFIPIGAYLDVVGTIPHMEATLYRTDYCRSRADKTFGTVDNGTRSISVGGSVSYTAYQMTRHAGVAASKIVVPRPGLQTLDRAFSLTHIQNAAALVWSSIGRIKWSRTPTYI